MTPEKSKSEPWENAQAEARDAIAAFEEILDVFPNDVGTLDALAQSCHLMGDPKRELHYLKRLIRVLLDQGDAEAAGAHAGRLKPLAADDEDAAELLIQLHALGVAAAESTAVGDGSEQKAEADGPAVPMDTRDAITEAETALAWSLKEAGVLSQDEYAEVIQDLTDICAQDAVLTVSVLHVLKDRSSRALETALEFIVRESRAPPAPLENMEPDEETMGLLPVETMILQGVTVFSHLGSDLLVAAVNPLRERLAQAVKKRVKRRCHWFTAHPSAFDAWIDRLQELEKAKAESEDQLG